MGDVQTSIDDGHDILRSLYLIFANRCSTLYLTVDLTCCLTSAVKLTCSGCGEWRNLLPVWDVQTSMFARWNGHHLKGDLRTNVRHRTMSSRWGRTSSTYKWSEIHGMFRRCTSSCQHEMFWPVRLRDTHSGSGNGKDEPVLQTHGQISGSDISLHSRYDSIIALYEMYVFWKLVNDRNYRRLSRL